MRIFAKYLYDSKFSKEKIFTIETPGGVVRAEITEEVKKKAKTVKVDMGKANFISAEIPVKCAKNECIDEVLNLEYKDYIINCVSVGNPHCVILKRNSMKRKSGSLVHTLKTTRCFLTG